MTGLVSQFFGQLILDLRFEIEELKKATPQIDPGLCTLDAFGQFLKKNVLLP
jgi:hypothetical protein